jgi:hypothetical protein
MGLINILGRSYVIEGTIFGCKLRVGLLKGECNTNSTSWWEVSYKFASELSKFLFGDLVNAENRYVW